MNPESLDILLLPSVSLDERSQLPCTPCIYFAIDSQGAIQYIGQSKNTKNRWKAHHKTELLKTMQGVRIAYIEVEKDLLLQVEQALIQWFDPPLNRLGFESAYSVPMRVSVELEAPDLGQRIREVRHTANRTITQLAADADVSVANWYAIEQERVKVLPITTLRRIERVLGVSFGVEA